jgi:hypothetical protein
LPPAPEWKSIRIRTTSPARRVIDQQFVDRVVGNVCVLELSPPRLTPGGIFFGHAPLEYDLNRFSRRNPRCDLRRDRNLAVRRELTFEVSGRAAFTLQLATLGRSSSARTGILPIKVIVGLFLCGVAYGI